MDGLTTTNLIHYHLLTGCVFTFLTITTFKVRPPRPGTRINPFIAVPLLLGLYCASIALWPVFIILGLAGVRLKRKAKGEGK